PPCVSWSTRRQVGSPGAGRGHMKASPPPAASADCARASQASIFAEPRSRGLMHPFGDRRDARSPAAEPIRYATLSGLQPGRTLLLLCCRRDADLALIAAGQRKSSMWTDLGRTPLRYPS